jgi:hypothetical protein
MLRVIFSYSFSLIANRMVVRVPMEADGEIPRYAGEHLSLDHLLRLPFRMTTVTPMMSRQFGPRLVRIALRDEQERGLFCKKSKIDVKHNHFKVNGQFGKCRGDEENTAPRTATSRRNQHVNI